jgi:hypothetical protein
MLACLYYLRHGSHCCPKEKNQMIFIANKINRMMVVVDTASFRMPLPEDKFLVKLTTDKRQYMVVNLSSRPAPMYRVQFGITESGVKLAACECEDFKHVHRHGRQCKHIHVAYNLHVARMQAEAAATV